MNKKSQDFSYDANGNLIYTATGTIKDTKLQAANTRKLLWDEENRLLGVSDNGFVSNYWYDASGERTVKESFDNEGVYVNGALSGARTGTSKFTAYVSPYMVVSQGGNYTKHVYMGSQRITSKVSNSGIFTTSPVKDTLQSKYAVLTSAIKERFDSLGVIYKGTAQTGGLVSSSPATTADSYFYHSDHLGSSSLITNKDGYLVQNIQYVPFGEVFVEERNATWSTPYKFNGKEQDEETGLCYYGARYYDPRTSVWLSVDPLAEKKPNFTSYNYCSNNPINMVDPDGLSDYNVDVKGYHQKINYSIFSKEFWKSDGGKDRLIASNGVVLDKIDKGILDSKVTVKYDKNPDHDGHYMKTDNDYQASRIYYFLSENTGVEWSHLGGMNGDDKNANYISTTHDNLTEKTSSYILGTMIQNKDYVKIIEHSHLFGEPPSGFRKGEMPDPRNKNASDKGMSLYLKANLNYNVIQKVYDVKHRKDIPYNEKSKFK